MTELTDALQEMVAERSNPGSTHYDGCWRNHLLCAALFAADELAALQAENERLREAITDALHWAQVAIDALRRHRAGQADTGRADGPALRRPPPPGGDVSRQRGRYSPVNPVCQGTPIPCPGSSGRPVRSGIVGTNAELLAEASQLWITDDDVVLDVTYGRGAFWNLIEPRNFVGHDLALDGVDFRHLPESDDSVDVVVFDPPYRPSHGSAATESYASRYGLTVALDTITDVVALYEAGIKEAARVLRPAGRVLVKCQDMSYGHRLHLVSLDVMRLLIDAGFDIADQFVLIANPGPGRTNHRQERAKRSHSVLWIAALHPQEGT